MGQVFDTHEDTHLCLRQLTRVPRTLLIPRSSSAPKMYQHLIIPLVQKQFPHLFPEIYVLSYLPGFFTAFPSSSRLNTMISIQSIGWLGSDPGSTTPLLPTWGKYLSVKWG